MNNIDEIASLFESQEIKKIEEMILNDQSIIGLKTSDGWNLTQLAAFYNAPSIFNKLKSISTFEQLNCTGSISPLLIAFEEGNFEFLTQVLSSDIDKIDLGVKERSGENLLYLACLKNNNDLAKILFDNGISCFEKSNSGDSALSQVIQNGNVKLFDYFNELSNLRDNYDELFIKKSIQYDNDEILARLLPLSRTDRDELFNLSSGFSSIKCLNTIMQSGEVIPGRDQINKIIDLITKKCDNDEENEASASLANYLFEIKIPFNQFVNSQGQSAWMLCIQNNNNVVFDMLMNSSENVNISDTEQHSPLFYAIERGNLSMVKTLLKKKANPNHKDKQNNTPILKAVELGRTEIVKELLKYTHQVNEVNLQNESPMTIAIKKRRMDIVADLIWSGGEITTNPVKHIEEKQMFHFGSNGESDRFSYHEEEQIDNFVSLAKLGFRLDQRNEEGDTFLLHFIKNGYIENFAALMRCQVNVNQADNEGNTAIMCAAAKKQDEYFNAIVRKFGNIDFNIKNNDGETVYDICFKHHKTSRIQKLISIDPNITFEKVKNSLKMVAKDGDFNTISNAFKVITVKELNSIDDSGNNLLMFCLAGGNYNNFKFLVENGCELDLSRQNKFGHSIKSMIEAIPVAELKNEFKSLVKKNSKRP